MPLKIYVKWQPFLSRHQCVLNSRLKTNTHPPTLTYHNNINNKYDHLVLISKTVITDHRSGRWSLAKGEVRTTCQWQKNYNPYWISSKEWVRLSMYFCLYENMITKKLFYFVMIHSNFSWFFCCVGTGSWATHASALAPISAPDPAHSRCQWGAVCIPVCTPAHWPQHNTLPFTPLIHRFTRQTGIKCT